MGFLDNAADSGLLGGLASFGQGFLKGMNDAEDRKYKRLEFEAKLKAAEREVMDKKRQQEIELFKSGYDTSGGTDNISGLKFRPDYVETQTGLRQAGAIGDPYGLKQLQAQKGQYDLAKDRREAQQAAKGFKLPPDKVLQVQQGAQIPKQLESIDQVISSNDDLFGPMAGRVRGANPYDTRAQSVDAQIRASAQAFGRYMEGGVLRKEDEEKYRKMFPNLADAPNVAANKLAIVKKLLTDKQNADVQALSSQGYDVSGFSPLQEAALPAGLIPRGSDLEAKKRRLEELRRKAAK